MDPARSRTSAVVILLCKTQGGVTVGRSRLGGLGFWLTVPIFNGRSGGSSMMVDLVGRLVGLRPAPFPVADLEPLVELVDFQWRELGGGIRICH